MSLERTLSLPLTWAESLCREHQLLLLCARASIDRETAERVRRCTEAGIEWDEMLRLAERHAIAPLVGAALLTACAGSLPAHVHGRLGATMRANALCNLGLVGELVHVSTTFERSGIRCLALKGPALSLFAYGSIARRTFADLDVLVRPADLPAAREILETHGYRLAVSLAEAQHAEYRRTRHAYAFTSRDGRIALELHWAITPRHFVCPLDLAGMFERRVALDVVGHTVYQAEPADQLVILSVHGTNHRWERLQWIADVAELLRACSELKWSRVWAEARRAGSVRMVRLALRLAADLLDAPLPEEVRDDVSGDAAVARLAQRVRHRLFATPRPRPSGLALLQFHLAARERLRDRIRCCLWLPLATSERDWEAGPATGRAALIVRRSLRLLRDYPGRQEGAVR